MTHAEVYQELERDRENLTRWVVRQKEALRRPVLKSKAFPFHVWHEYTSPRRVKYLIFSRIFDKRMRRILTGAVAIRRDKDGMTVYTTWLGHQKLIAPMVLLPHMWMRYAERVKVEKSGIELVRHYFTNNAHGKNTDNELCFARSVRYNGKEHLALCVNDGILLGDVIGDFFFVNTFITYDMTSGVQQRVFESLRQTIRTDRQLYEEAKGYYRRELYY